MPCSSSNENKFTFSLRRYHGSVLPSSELASSILHSDDSGATGKVTHDVMANENDQC